MDRTILVIGIHKNENGVQSDLHLACETREDAAIAPQVLLSACTRLASHVSGGEVMTFSAADFPDTH